MRAQEAGPKFELRAWQHGVIFLIACALIVSRRPDAIFNPQFRYEDGSVWYANAYEYGWLTALFRPWQGYFQTLPRLGASLALLVPLARAPLVLALVAVAVQALPVRLLLSTRSSVWGSLRFRALLAGIFIALPFYRELGAIMTGAQWFLALNAFLVLVSSEPQTSGERLFDISILTLCGLTGPFCVVLLPIAIFLAWRYGHRWRWVLAVEVGALSIVQAWALLVVDRHGRPHHFLGASPELFANLIASKVYLGTLLGSNALAFHPGLWSAIILLFASFVGTAILLVCSIRACCEMKLFILFAYTLLAASLISPMVGVPAGFSVWQFLTILDESRYWFFPMLAFAWAVLWCSQSRIPLARASSVVLLCIMCFGIIREWRQPALRDMHFAEDARRFEAAPEGTVVVIPEGTEPWKVTLVKH